MGGLKMSNQVGLKGGNKRIRGNLQLCHREADSRFHLRTTFRWPRYIMMTCTSNGMTMYVQCYAFINRIKPSSSLGAKIKRPSSVLIEYGADELAPQPRCRYHIAH